MADTSEGKPRIKWAFALDLPPNDVNKDNFLHVSDPPAHIYVTGAEFTSGVTAMCRHLARGVHVEEGGATDREGEGADGVRDEL